MEKLISFLLFISISQSIISQADVLKTYKISAHGYPQKLVLIEYEDGTHEGYLSTTITRLHRGEREEIMDKYYPKNLNVSDLMQDLKNNGIEAWKNCDDSNDCGNITFLNSRFFSFEIHLQKVRKKKYQKVDNMSEELFNPLWNEGLKFIKVIENYIDFFREFEDLFRRLPEGTYERSKIDEITIVTIKR